ncbi:MAG: hypothetical protein ACXW31_07525, partial [Thermoanaerobaculia bacterium]
MAGDDNRAGKQKAESRRQKGRKAEGRRQKAEGGLCRVLLQPSASSFCLLTSQSQKAEDEGGLCRFPRFLLSAFCFLLSAL